jgi:hypothetical protein
MTTHTNTFGEKVTKWESHKHPDNPNYMQVVFWTIWEKPDGRITIGYKLDGNGKTRFVRDITITEALNRFTDDNS